MYLKTGLKTKVIFMYSIESEKIWKSISQDSSNYDFVKRLVPINTARDFSLGYRLSEMSLSIILDIPKKFLPKKIPKAKGFIIKYLTLTRNKNLTRLTISLTEKKFKKTFYKVTDILLNSLDGIKEDKKIVKILFNELNSFQDFFKQLDQKKGLSLNLQQGLFAELDFLEKELFKKLTIKESLMSWHAPERSAHDFSRKGRVVEIKSTYETPPKKIKISNEYQLDEGNMEKLYLCTYEIKRNSNDGITIVDKIERIREKIRLKDINCLNLFNVMLVKIGYFEENKNFYSSTFKINRRIFHDVKGNFPRLTPSKLPKGIDKTSYNLDLNYCHKYLTSKDIVLNKFCE